MIETYSFGKKKRIPPAFRLMQCDLCGRDIAQHNLKAHRGSKPCRSLELQNAGTRLARRQAASRGYQKIGGGL